MSRKPTKRKIIIQTVTTQTAMKSESDILIPPEQDRAAAYYDLIPIYKEIVLGASGLKPIKYLTKNSHTSIWLIAKWMVFNRRNISFESFSIDPEPSLDSEHCLRIKTNDGNYTRDFSPANQILHAYNIVRDNPSFTLYDYLECVNTAGHP